MRTSIGSYRIGHQLGEGGMGVVYSAFDERLQRPVALKTLRANSIDPAARERLWREARAAASVSHPNICQIFDVGEVDGEIYLAMELLDGEPLAARLSRGTMSLADAGALVLAVLAALESIHQKGLVHRDLKPSNVFLTAHGVKLVDFGLAVFAGPAPPGASTRLTMAGSVVGTPHYMAPEQVRGDAVDQRTDLFSLGTMFFEMLSGQPPFLGATTVDVMHAILHAPLPPLPAAAAAASPLVTRATAKAPGDRFASARDMASALRALITSGVAASGHADSAVRPADGQPATRLIVLPFKLLRPDPEIDFLPFSLADAVTTSLSGVGSLIVRSSLTAARYADGTPDLALLAREANVDVLLAGTLLRVGGHLRVAAQLVEVPAGTVLWSETSKVSFDDVFALQDDLARQIVSSLELPLTAREDRLMRRDVPANARAYEWYLRGVQLSTQPASWTEARDLLERCVAADPTYAPAWARLGRLYRLLGKYSQDSDTSGPARAEAAFRRALELNPDLSFAHSAYAALEVELGRPAAAMVRLLTLARQRPTDATLFSGLVHACRYCGLLDASLAAQVHARLLDPKINTSVWHTYFMLGQYKRAFDEPDRPLDASIAIQFALMGETGEALKEVLREEERMQHGTLTFFTTALHGLLEGRNADAWAALDRLEHSGFQDPEGWFYMSLVMARLGGNDRALALLERTVQRGYAIPTTLQQNAWLSPLRELPAFQELVAEAMARHRQAVDAYAAADGPAVLGVPATTQPSSVATV